MPLQVKGCTIGTVTTLDESSNRPNLPENQTLEETHKWTTQTQMKGMNQHQLVNLQPSQQKKDLLSIPIRFLPLIRLRSWNIEISLQQFGGFEWDGIAFCKRCRISQTLMWEVGAEIPRRPVEWYSVEGVWDIVFFRKYLLISLFRQIWGEFAVVWESG